MRRWERLMVGLCFAAAVSGAWAQIPAVVTLPVNDGRRVELKESAGLVYRPVHYDPNAPKPPQSMAPRAVKTAQVSVDSIYVPVAEALAKSEPSTLLRADKSHVVEMWVRFAIPAAMLNEACASRAHNPQFMSTLTPNPEDVEKVMAWLTSVGFTDGKAEKPDISYRTISFKGTVDVIEQAFRTQVYSYTLENAYAPLPADRYTTYYTNGTNLSVPEALSPVIDKVFGLSPTGIGGICNGIKMVP
jgi:Pro-kumamolisin, activation domain